MKFYITALDTSGTVTLHRDSVPAAIKKASELISDGCLNVEIVMPDGATYPETVLLRLINSQGRPNVKLAATEDGSGLTLGGESDPAHVQIMARGAAMSLKLSNTDGQQQLIKP